MKNTILILLLILVCSNVSAQNNGQVQWSWTGTYGSTTDNSIANHLVVDDTSNLYIAGVFRGELIVQTDTIYCNPNEDHVFVAKFDSLGTLKWITRIDWGYYVNAIGLDSENHLRVLCNAGTMIVYDNDGSPITYYPVPNSVADYNSTAPYGITVDFKMDSLDNIYFLQNYDNATSNELSAYTSVYSSPDDTLTALLWEDYVQLGLTAFPVSAAGIEVDDDLNVYISGTTDFALSLAGTDIVSNMMGMNSIFSYKYNSVGDAVWLATNENQFFSYMLGTGINPKDSSYYFTGYTVMEEVYYGDTLSVDTTNQQQIFLVKFDLDGGHEWSKPYPLATKTLKTYPNASWGALGSHIQISDSGYVYLKGSFTGSIIFNNDTLVEDTSTVLVGYIADDVFIAKLDENGNPIWGKYGGNQGGNGLETGDFYVDPTTDQLYLVGYWTSQNNLNKFATPTNGVKNIFLGKEGEPSSVSIAEVQLDKGRMLIYPNPTQGIFTASKPPNSGNVNYTLLNLQGREIANGKITKDQETIDISEHAAGMYILRTLYGTIRVIKR